MATLSERAFFPDIDGLLWGWQWDANLPNGHTLLTYAFPVNALSYTYGDPRTFIYDMEPFNAQQQFAARQAIANFDAVSNLDFVFTTDEANANIRFAEAYMLSYNDLGYVDGQGFHHITTAEGNPPDPSRTPSWSQGDCWFNSTDYNSPVKGNYAYATIIHELGHSLGLKHGHEASQGVYSADGIFLYTATALPANYDSLEYSIMTYRAYPGSRFYGPYPNKEFPTTLMQDDIFALQWMYGPNYAHNAGNTVYSWSPATGATFVNGVSQGATLNAKIFLTIWDGGGIDTYDFSNYTTKETIDLNPGAWSTPSLAQRADLDGVQGQVFARGCIANALVFLNDLHGFIENAFGGSSNDRIVGNFVNNALRGNGGNDILFGQNGQDGLSGGLGNDSMQGGLGVDRLTGGAGRDVQIGGGQRDIFDFNAVGETGKTAATRDIIRDFLPTIDDIDLSTIDANGPAPGHTFVWRGIGAFTGGKGQLHYKFEGPAKTIVEGDINGDKRADFQIELSGHKVLTAGDFIL